MTEHEQRILGLREMAILYHWKATTGNHPIPDSLDARYSACTVSGFRQWLASIGETMTAAEEEALREHLSINSTRTADHIDAIHS